MNEPLITITGNLTADPELRYVGSGQPVANFTIATTPRVKNTRTGEYEDGETMFVQCSVWREYAEHVADSLRKGMQAIVTGRLKVQTYQTQQGEQRTSLKLDVDECGPALRFATAQVTRAHGGGGATTSYNQSAPNMPPEPSATMWDAAAPPF